MMMSTLLCIHAHTSDRCGRGLLDESSSSYATVTSKIIQAGHRCHSYDHKVMLRPSGP